jgi:hypothetical protein
MPLHFNEIRLKILSLFWLRLGVLGSATQTGVVREHDKLTQDATYPNFLASLRLRGFALKNIKTQSRKDAKGSGYAMSALARVRSRLNLIISFWLNALICTHAKSHSRCLFFLQKN